MRISDWSSDVCSSDLDQPSRMEHAVGKRSCSVDEQGAARALPAGVDRQADERAGAAAGWHRPASDGVLRRRDTRRDRGVPLLETRRPRPYRYAPRRSEEHTSELQSLMRNSYAVLRMK